MFSVPTRIAPACSSFLTRKQSSAAGARSRLIFEPASVARPRTSNRFLTANGTPARGPAGFAHSRSPTLGVNALADAFSFAIPPWFRNAATAAIPAPSRRRPDRARPRPAPPRSPRCARAGRSRFWFFLSKDSNRDVQTGERQIPPASSLLQVAVVGLQVEPVGVALDALLHRHVHVGLRDRDARHLVEGDVDEAVHVLLVFLPVALEARGLDQLVHPRVLVAHGVEHRVLAVIAPEEEILRVIEPAPETIQDQRQVPP